MEPRVCLSALCLLFSLASVLGFGVDPSVQIDVLTELQLGDSVAGVLQVQGLHNGSKAFFFQALLLIDRPLINGQQES
uniref:Protein kinase C-binding protein nell2 n=1 Tax=Sphaerodactylus townsendi TaxID=933632 RepID=A0ACB8FP17_9SAUR